MRHTCNIRFPTDLSLLGEAREKTEAVIDQFHGWITGQRDEPVKNPHLPVEGSQAVSGVAKQKKPGEEDRKAYRPAAEHVRRNRSYCPDGRSAPAHAAAFKAL